MRHFLCFILLIPVANAADQRSHLDILEGLQRLFGLGPKSETTVSGECVNRIAALDWKDLSCTRLLEGYCKAAWLPGTEGNFEAGASRFRMGKSAKGGLMAVERENLDALLRARSKLLSHPDALVKKFMEAGAPILNRLEWHLEQEQDSDRWRKGLGEIAEEWSSLLKTWPAQHSIVPDPALHVSDHVARALDSYHRIHDAITTAKWEGTNNWKLVEVGFEKARRHLIASITDQSFPEAQKAQMIERLKRVTLHLPLSSPEVFGWRNVSPCASTDVNAFYTTLTNRITVCAGLFNGYASESLLLGVLAHELGHAVDPRGYATESVENSPTRTLLQKASQTGVDCTDWSKSRDAILASPKPEPEVPVLQKLYDCLVSDFRPMRRPWNASVMENDAWAEVDAVIQDLSREKALSTIVDIMDASPEKLSKVMEANGGYIHANCAHRHAHSSFKLAFAHEWKCGGAGPRDTRMKNAMAKAAELVRRSELEKSAKCGDYCNSGPSSPAAGEFFADWLAARAMERDLAESPASQRLARATEASVFWCDPKKIGHERDAVGVSERDLINVHPYSGSRFNAFVSLKARKEIGCRIDDDEPKTYAECKP